MEPPSAGAALAASLAAGLLATADASLEGAVVAPPELPTRTFGFACDSSSADRAH